MIRLPKQTGSHGRKLTSDDDLALLESTVLTTLAIGFFSVLAWALLFSALALPDLAPKRVSGGVDMDMDMDTTVSTGASVASVVATGDSVASVVATGDSVASVVATGDSVASVVATGDSVASVVATGESVVTVATIGAIVGTTAGAGQNVVEASVCSPWKEEKEAVVNIHILVDH
jgi:hypothetical protein